MSISIFKKAAAFVCGAATMLSLSAALFASAEGPMVFTADQVYAKPGETVSYSVSLSNNSGYAASGLSLIFDERLEIQNVEGRYIKPVNAGPAASGLNTTLGYNSGKHQIGWSTMGSGDDCTQDGILYTIEVKVPDDAKAGDTFVMDLGEISQLVNSAKEARTYELVDGWIKIKPEETTTEEPTTTTTTTTSSSSSDDITTTTTISQEPGTGDSSDTTDTTTTVSGEGSGATDATDATSNNNGGGDVPGPKTGETGAALAIAGLLTAAGAAYAIRRKH